MRRQWSINQADRIYNDDWTVRMQEGSPEMNWSKAQANELCTVILFDPMATEEDKDAAGRELFKRIGSIRGKRND